jgi:hypothetical protein
MFMKKLKLEASAWTLVLLSLLIGGLAAAGTIKNWATSDTLTAADLNGNFTHIHNLMVGGHGARLIDADVNAGAAIASSKLAAYRYIPVAWANVTCSPSTCTINAGSSTISTVGYTGAGIYSVNLSPALTDASFLAVVSPQATGNARSCQVGSPSSSSIPIRCFDIGASTVTPADMSFNILVLDNN